MKFVGRNCRNPRDSFGKIVEGTEIHGISNGNWSLSDGIRAILSTIGPSDLVISTWTAAVADLSKAARLLRDRKILSLRLLVDRSFESRQPKYCERARLEFGDEAIRVWSSHAKFTLLLNGAVDVLYLTSANLNQNARLENYSIYAGGPLPGEYLALVEELWIIQKPGEAFDGGSSCARRQTRALLGEQVKTRSVDVDGLLRESRAALVQRENLMGPVRE